MTTVLPFTQDLRQTDFLAGALLLVDKPKGWTSFDVVNKVRGMLRKKYGVKNIKVGHSGTLDPMATGLLLICTGRWTKELHHLQGLDKVYEAEITLGIETDSYDAEGKITAQLPVPPISTGQLEEVLAQFTGEYDQYPPVFSAIKKDGKPLYELARAGKEVKTEARKVIVYSIRLQAFDSPRIHLEVHCGSGFYVRSLAHDVGQTLGCGAHLTALRRTAVGPYALAHAWTMEELSAGIQ